MNIKLPFDYNLNIDDINIILKDNSLNNIGNISNFSNVNMRLCFNSPYEISFDVYKEINGKQNIYWNLIKDLAIVYIEELDKNFKIYVSTDDSDITIKHVIGNSLCEDELSHIKLYDIHINTPDDILREDYTTPTVFYNSNPKISLLDRVLQKAPHYSLKHIDERLMKLQYVFEFNSISIYDALVEISNKVKCIFIYDSKDRTISAYDLMNYCIDCGKRFDEHSQVCPYCDSSNIIQGIGNDTCITVSSNNIANLVSIDGNEENYINCLRLRTGDEYIDATIRNIMPNGSEYIYYFDNNIRKDMPTELVNKLDEYNKVNQQYTNDYILEFSDNELKSKYNQLITKYNNDPYKVRDYDDKGNPVTKNNSFMPIGENVKGFNKVANLLYDNIDFSMFIEHSLMPIVLNKETTIEEDILNLNEDNLSPFSLSELNENTTKSTVEIFLKKYCNLYLKNSYIVSFEESEYDYEGESTDGWNYGNWIGKIRITTYGNEEQTKITNVLHLKVTNNYELFLKEKVMTTIRNQDDEIGSIYNVIKIEDDEKFKIALKEYSLERLNSFYDAYKSGIDVMIEADQASESSDFYKPIYVPLYKKYEFINTERQVRIDELDTINKVQENLEKVINEIQTALNMESFIGIELWKLLKTYIREDVYTNDNITSEGLSNKEVIDIANEVISLANKNIKEIGYIQKTITCGLNNFLSIPEFKEYTDDFELGNWIVTEVDEQLYYNRFIALDISFNNGNIEMSVELSQVTTSEDELSDAKSVLSQATSIAGSIGEIKSKVEQSYTNNEVVKSWLKDGLNLTNMKIVSSAKNQSVIYDKNGLLVRSYDDIEDSYLPEQLKIVNSTIAITDDNWKTVKTAVGKFYYVDPLTGEKKTAYGINGEVLVGSLVLGERLLIKNNDETLQFNGNGLVLDSKHDINGQYNDIINIKVDGRSVFYVNKLGDLVISPTAHLGDKGTIDDYINSLSQDFKTLNVILSNDLSTIPTDSNGNNGNYSSCTSSVQVFYGSSDVTKQSVITHQASTGVQYSVVGNTITVTNLTSDSGYVEVAAAYDNGKIVAKKKFTIVKQKQGIQGQDGIPGSNGTNGKTSYFHIKYSNKPNPTVSSDITEIPSTYIGTYVDFTEVDSADPKKYTWSRFEGQKGENGIAGINGIDGKTSYLHIAYANSQDGSVGFSVSDSANKLYIGQYTDFVLQDSVDYKRYSWTKIKGNDGLNGANGQNAILYQIISSTNVIKLTQNNVLQPANVTFNSVSRVGNSTSTTPFAGRFKIEESLNGSSYTTKYTSSANESTKVWTPSSKDVVSIRCSLYMTDGKTLVDMQSVTILTDISQLTQKIVFDKLTDNGRLQGLFMQDSKLYINASYLSTGIITDKNGKFSLNMETGKAILNDGEFKGKITSTNGVIGGWNIQQGKLISYAGTNNTNYLELDSNNTSINFKKDKKSSTWNTEGIYFVDKSGSNETHTETETLSLKYGNIFIDYQWEDNDPSGYHTMGGDTAALMHGALQFEDPYHGLLSKFSLTTLLFESGGGYRTIFLDGENGIIKAEELITRSIQGTLITGKGSLYYLSTDVEIGCGSSGYENNAYVQAYNGYCSIRSHSQSIYNNGAYIDSSWSHGKFYPQNAGQALGTSAASNRWYRLYAANACNTSSDRRLKKDIAYFDEMPAIYSTGANVFEEFFNKLRGTTFVAKGDEFNRIKFGFIAQDVIEALQTVGLTAYDVDFVSHGRDENDKISEDAMYGLCYEEFIALNTHMIQKAHKKIELQQKEIDDLKKRLSTIENSKL